MTLRAAGKVLWFLSQVGVSVFDYTLTVARVSPSQKRLARASWLMRSAHRHLRIFGCTTRISGEIPRHGLLFCNHLSYFDILAIASVTPAVFVSKADVRRWPLFGWLAALGGTIFINRERRTHVGQVNSEVESALADGALVVIFPEGTSSNGETVLPFRSSLLEPATHGSHAVTVGWLHYELADGDAREDVCYWGEHTFFPHLLKLLGKSSVQTTLRFARFPQTTNDRKLLAGQLHCAVLALQEPGTVPGLPTSSPAP